MNNLFLNVSIFFFFQRQVALDGHVCSAPEYGGWTKLTLSAGRADTVRPALLHYTRARDTPAAGRLTVRLERSNSNIMLSLDSTRL